MTRGVNLIPASRKEAQRRRARIQTWIGVGVTYALLLGAACVWAQHRWGGVPDVGPELARTETRVNDLNAQIADVKKRLAEAQAQRATIEMLQNQPDWSILLALLARMVDEETVLRSVKITPRQIQGGPERYAVELRGLGRSQAATSQFILRLQETGLFEEVKLIRTGREPFLTGTAVSFDVEALL